MTLITAAADVAASREQVRPVHGQPYRAREYIGVAPKPGEPGYGEAVAGDGSPQGYLVMQPPHSVTPPHFHQTNQFQVFVGGGGSVGKLRADPFTVQYAGANTPYGPITAEADGIHYFTLRQEWDSGAKWMPERRDDLVRGVQRQVVGVADAAAPTPGKIETLIEETEDGLLAVRIAVAPGETARLPDASAGGGQYHVVASGSLLRDGVEYGPLSIEFADAEAGVVEVAAGEDGLELIYARFPRR